MLNYILRRIFYTVLMLFAVLTVVFFLVRAIPGDPAAATMRGWVDKETAEAIAESLGLTKPVLTQYAYFLRNLFTGTMPKSYYYNVSVLTLVGERLLATVQLSFAALIVAVVGSLLLGTVAAMNAGKFLDKAFMALALTGQSLPDFWIGIMLILVFARTLRLLPTSGIGSLKHLVLPMMTMVLPLMSVTARLVRSSLLEVFNMDYVRTARSKGLSEWGVLVKHALRNSLVGVVTFIGMQLGNLLGGVVVIETVFGWPGLGSLTVNSILTRDYPVIQMSAFAMGAFFMFINLTVDISYGFLNPRIRIEAGRSRNQRG